MREILIVACLIFVAWLGVSLCRIVGQKLVTLEAAKNAESSQKLIDENIREEKAFQERQKQKDSLNGIAQKLKTIPELNSDGSSQGTGSACDGNP